MKNRKIISLICALSMVFTMLGAFTASAANTKGMAIDASLSEDGKTITAEFSAVGTVGGLSSFMIAVNVPEGVELADITTEGASGSTLTTNVADGVYYGAFLDLTGAGKEFADNKLATLTIALDAPLASDYVMTLQGDASIQDTEGGVKVKNGNMDATTVTIGKWVDPDAPTPRPTSPVRPTAAPIETAEPVPTAVPVSGKGIGLEASIDETNTVITLNATANETVGGLSSFMLAFNVPEGVELADITTEGASDSTLTTNVADGVYYGAFLDLTGAGKEFADGKLATVTITLPEALTSPYLIALADDASIQDTEGGVKVKNGNMTRTSVVITPNTGDVEEPVSVVDLVDCVAKNAAEEVAKYDDVYITVEVTKKGEKAVYGTDYTATFNGKELTENEYTNLISGYTEENMADVINGLKFNIYNSDVDKIATTVNAVDEEGNATQIVDPTENELNPTPTTKPTSPSLTVSPTSKSMAYNTIMTVTSTVKNPVEGGTLTYTIKNPSETKIVLEKLGDATYDAATGKGTARFASLEASGTATITVAYVDAAGETITSKDIKVTVSKSTTGSSTGSSDDDDDTSSSGIIAPPFGGTPTPAPGYKPNFQDLDSVPWAVEAINGLAARGMVKGRSETVFDPNANITRAEYCQMLVNAINAGNAAAESTYTDVPSDAWYYNAVSVASRLGIVNGLGDGNFGPNELITRQDMAVMTYRAAQSKQINLDPVNDQITFEDSNDIASYAFEAVMTLQKAGIINGMTETTFEPLSNATRAQSAKILYETFVK